MRHYRRKNTINNGECKPKRKLADPKLFDFVKQKFLQENWSPEQIAARLKYEQSALSISFVSIYRGIYAGWFDEKGLSHGARGAIRKLRHRGKRRHTNDYVEKRGKIPISHHLTERPSEAETRSRLGNREADTVLGAAGKACLLTLTDRKSRFSIVRKLPAKRAESVAKAMSEALHNQPLESITPDRGKEFAKHQ